MRQNLSQVLDVIIDQMRLVQRLASCFRNDHPGIGDQRLDASLKGGVQLLAASGEDLDAVIFEGIVRRGDDDAGVERIGSCQICHPGVGSDARADDHWRPRRRSRRVSSRSIHSPDSRVSRPSSTRTARP